MLSYLGVILAIFAVVGVTLYQRMATRLYEQFDRELAIASRTAIELFPLVAHEYHEHIAKPNETGLAAREPSPAPPQNLSVSQLLAAYRDENDRQPTDPITDAIDRSVNFNHLTLEWFDGNLQQMLLASDPQGRIPSRSRPEIDIHQLDRAVSEDGSIRRWVTPVYDVNRRLLGYVRASGVTVSISTELDQLVLELWFGAILAFGLAALSGQWLTRLALRPIVQSSEQLRRFTADASHELRSPLTSISTSAATLQRLPEETALASCHSSVNRIVQASDRMALLVRDLLLLARVDGGVANAIEDARHFSLDELLEDLVDELEPRAQQNGIQLNFDCASAPNDGDLWNLCGRPQELERAFANTIENALQYTPSGGEVSVKLDRLGDKIAIRIRDTGIGIAPADLPHVFDRFWRADRARERRTNGSGLGLAIVATIVREHGGKVDVASELGRGSCFCLWLPAARTIS